MQYALSYPKGVFMANIDLNRPPVDFLNFKNELINLMSCIELVNLDSAVLNDPALLNPSPKRREWRLSH